MRGWARLNKPRTKTSVEEAVSIFEQALELEPELPQALTGLSRAIIHRVAGGWSKDKASDVDRSDRIITKVLDGNHHDAMALYVKGDVLRARHEFDEALAMYAAATEADRNFAVAYATAGVTKILSGRAKEARPLVSKALRLSPRDPLLNIYEYYICHSYTHEANWEETVRWCNKSVADGPFWQAVIDLAAAHAWLGNEAAARNAVTRLLELMPGYTVQKWANAGWSANPTFLVEYQRIIEGLRKAGLPEGDAPRQN
jgi:tetratricopeptide (TPR) repeat protein